jgi:RHS repeat-associated protein
MKRPSLPLAPTRLPRRSFAKAGVLALAFASLSQLHAQVGNNNANGFSGIFNGQIHTGCSYDPYTGNATRSITDIAVAGAVGEYPLALVRTANSRTPSTTEVFGRAGGWNHNYNWILEDSPTSTTANFQPSRYTVDFPDGRVETFRAVTWDPNYYRVRPGAETPAQSTSAGVRERFVPLNLSTMLAYLILPDGGKVEFTAWQHTSGSRYYYKYSATAIIDPYGLRTTLQWEVVGPNNLRRLVWVIEPAGRYLHFFYTTANGPRISQVTASDGRNVNYYYVYSGLDHVTYYNNPNWIAHYRYCAPNIGDPDTVPKLLWTVDDPMYPGPMKRIAYEYKPATPNNPDNTVAVYGQILNERYWDGNLQDAPGAIVSTLTVGEAPNVTWKRKETRGDGATRTFVYSGAGYVTWASDFMGHQSTMGYDSYKYLNSFIDFNRNETDYTCESIIGNVTQIKYPLTQGDTPGQGQRPTVNYTYTNDYYLHTITDEGNHTTTITRDGNNRVTQIGYPDGGYETFGYDASHFYQLSSHRMKTAGTETFTYNGRASLRDTYRNPGNASANPTARYQYDTRDRVSDITDVLGTSSGDPNHTTSFTYSDRGQLTVTTLPNDNGARHTIKNYYNADGTIYAKENELYQATNYTYDDYRRLKSVTPPVRGFGDTNTYTTSFSYYVNGMGDDYGYTDSNVAWVHLPSGKWINTVYDNNRRKTSVTVAWNTSDAATTSYGYDNVGNVTSVTNPLSHATTTAYDERNRPSSIYVGGHLTTIEYDTSGRKYRITRPNGQTITYTNYDAMNRVRQQTASNVSRGNNQNIVTLYTYYTPQDPGTPPVGLLHTMQDPHLVNSGDQYTYAYDNMGRKLSVTYPAESDGTTHRHENFTYDTSGRLRTYSNRANIVQTFYYDALNRMSYFTWANGLAPRVDFGYDVGSRLISIDNANATISRSYFNDNLLRTETETPTGASAKAVTYSYDADGNRASIQYPDTYSFSYTYTGRNQLKTVGTNVTYAYDLNGNLITRTLANSTSTSYAYDALDRVTWVQHFLNGTGRTFQYGYETDGNNRLWAKRLITPAGSPEANKGEVFDYDLNDQVIAMQLNILNPDATPAGAQTISYDANGNRTWFQPPGWNEQYTTDNLSQYTSINNSSLTYRADANLATYNGATYNYDAQNRLTSVSNTATFKYDGLNRQVSRTVGGATTYNVYDGWDLIEECQANGTLQALYVYGAGGLVLSGNYQFAPFWKYHYQDGSGSISHLADSTGNLLEWYRYDLDGTPIFYGPNDIARSPQNSAYGVRHLFAGQQWYSELGLYDLRNRFYSPDIGRFLQPDPIGFRGDRTNLYRYCGNNPVTRWDPFGLVPAPLLPDPYSNIPSVPRVIVRGAPTFNGGGGGPSGGGGGGEPGGRGGRGGPGIYIGGKYAGPGFTYRLPPRNDNSNTQQQPPPQNPPSPSDIRSLGLSPALQALVVTLPSGEQYMPMTTIKNISQAQILGRFVVVSTVPIFVPPGENPQGTINFWSKTTYPDNLVSFGLAFMPKGPNDFKFNISPIYDAYGNFLYGASGQAAGMTASLLQAMAAAIHPGGQNDPINVYDIQQGIDAVGMGGTMSVVPIGFTDF